MHVTNPLSLTPKELTILGRLCATQKPDVAKELLSIYDTKPVEQDHAKIPSHFNRFCQLQDMNPDEYRGNLFKSKKSDLRRLFVACMVRMYLPHLYAAPRKGVRLAYGFTQALAKTFHLKGTNVAVMIREIVVHEKAYSEFRASVDEITSKLINT